MTAITVMALAKELRAEQDRNVLLELRDGKLAFYDAVRQNDPAVVLVMEQPESVSAEVPA